MLNPDRFIQLPHPRCDRQECYILKEKGRGGVLHSVFCLFLSYIQDTRFPGEAQAAENLRPNCPNGAMFPPLTAPEPPQPQPPQSA